MGGGGEGGLRGGGGAKGEGGGGDGGGRGGGADSLMFVRHTPSDVSVLGFNRFKNSRPVRYPSVDDETGQP